jgi:hypothetical protein
MMRETFWKRLEALEEVRKLQDGPVVIRQLCFINPDRTEVEATIARGPGDFICRREPGESLDEFKARASRECPPGNIFKPPPILVFLTGESPNAV